VSMQAINRSTTERVRSRSLSGKRELRQAHEILPAASSFVAPGARPLPSLVVVLPAGVRPTVVVVERSAEVLNQFGCRGLLEWLLRRLHPPVTLRCSSVTSPGAFVGLAVGVAVADSMSRSVCRRARSRSASRGHAWWRPAARRSVAWYGSPPLRSAPAKQNEAAVPVVRPRRVGGLHLYR